MKAFASELSTPSGFLNQVTRGDCLQTLRHVPDQSIDFVLIDPPYILHYQDRLAALI